MTQATIARTIGWSGRGLHGGDEVEVALHPADADAGIVFVARGAGSAGADVEIPARADRVVSTARATSLAAPDAGVDGATPRVGTVEHLLASLFVFGIDNVRIEVRGDEIPVMDGSAAPFVAKLREAGRRVQDVPRRVLAPAEPIVIAEGDRSIRIDPAPTLRVSYAIDFDHPCIGRQSLELPRIDEQVFERELAAARTFGFTSELDALRDAGLANGGGFDNAIVLDEASILNQEGLRWPDEFVRHKVIDLLGDLALLGMGLSGHVRVERGGHGLHHRLVRALLEDAGGSQDAKSSSSLASATVLAGSLN